MRISDWSSDVCSSDLERLPLLDARSVSMSPDMPCPSERKDRASFKEVPEIFSDVSRDQPIVKNLDCTALQRLWTTYEPITVRAFDRHVEQPYEPDRKSTRLNSVTNAQLVCRLQIEK